MKRWGCGGVKQRHLWTSRGPASGLFFASSVTVDRIVRRAWTIGQIKNKMSKRGERISLRNCRDFGMAIWG